jgi:hypothetical protein
MEVIWETCFDWPIGSTNGIVDIVEVKMIEDGLIGGQIQRVRLLIVVKECFPIPLRITKLLPQIDIKLRGWNESLSISSAAAS